MDEAMKVAETIAGMGLPSVYAAKESINRAFETTLAEGVRFERRVFRRCSPRKIRRKAWRLSSRSARRNSE
jgi:enoyl-CoA hydratase/carnithine racemase